MVASMEKSIDQAQQPKANVSPAYCRLMTNLNPLTDPLICQG